MGVALSTNTGTSATAHSASLIPDELGGEVQYEKSLGTGSRFLKTIRAKHIKGALVVKVFVKPDSNISLQAIHRRLKVERDGLIGYENVLAYQKTLETDRAGYVLRQWVASNLYDRISTRPFLSSIEKKWIAFQLLTGLKQAHSQNIMHGDIKTENVLVTTHNWIYLSDFSSSFKPTFLPLNDPSTFSFFYDTSSRRTCYLAPERFYETDRKGVRGEVTKEMDIFSLGCVLAELWMEGTPIFTLSQLFKYRDGAYNPDAYLNEIEDVEIRGMIKSMISLDPNSRSTCEEYLVKYQTIAFPSIFYDFLHPFISALNTPSTPTEITSTPPSPIPTRFVSESTSTPTVTDQITNKGNNGGKMRSSNEADERIEKVWKAWEIIGKFLREEAGVEVSIESEESKGGKGIFPLIISIPGQESHALKGIIQDRSALVLLSLVCSNIRNCLRPSSILRGIDILLALNRYFSDETKLDRLIPYLVILLGDEVAAVRSAAMKALTQTLLLVQTLPPSNTSIFTEYIFPKMKSFSTDTELSVRINYAECLPILANCSKRFLEMVEALKMEGKFRLGDGEGLDGETETNYEAALVELHLIVQEHVYPLLSDPSTDVKRTLLTQVASLCNFFGRTKANDIVLSHLITYLNTRDWRLRDAFNRYSIELTNVVGVKSLEEYILPLIILSLSDAEENVIVRVLESLTILTEWKLLSRARIWELVTSTIGFLCHPNIWIREGAAAFLTCVSNSLESTDRWCILFPSIKRLLRSDVKEITELSLLDNAREPLTRVIFEAAVAWAGKSSKSHFWSVPRTPVKGAPRDTSIRIDEDNLQMEKMRQLGMKPEDEYKLSMLRDYINKLASARQPASRLVESNQSMLTSVSPLMQDLGVVPQTIFFGIRTVDQEVSTGSRRSSMSRNPDSPRRFSSTSRSASGPGPGLADDLRRKLLESSAASLMEPEVTPNLPIFTSTYDGDDPSIKQLLERVYLDSYRQPLVEFGPHIPIGIPRRRALRTAFPPKDRTPSRPAGTLIAHLAEHSASITSIQVSPDQIFFVTGSEDGTIKVWDTIRLEKNVTSKSRQTYNQGGKITALCFMENSRCVISASDNGTVWVFRVDVNLVGNLPKYGKQQLVRQWRTEGEGEYVTCLISYNTETTSNLVVGTSLCNINILDIRTMQLLHSFKNPAHFGPILCSCIDKNRIWLVVGTATGVLSLWDLRFGLLLKSWSIGQRRIQQINLHPTKGKGRWIVVAAEEELDNVKNHLIMEVWDIEKGTRVEDFRVITGSSTSRNLDSPIISMQDPSDDAASAIEALLNSKPIPNPIRFHQEPTETIKPNPGILTFLSGVDYRVTDEFNGTASGELVEVDGIVKKDTGFLITGGQDRKLRFWDLGRSSGSAVVSGLEVDEDKPVFTMNSSTTRPTVYLEAPTSITAISSRRLGVPLTKVHRSTLISNSQLELRACSHSAITAMGMIDLPFRCLVTGDRSGAIKVYE